MGTIEAMLNQLKGKRVYFDTNPIIYFVEGHETFYEAVKPIFDELDNEEFFACTSEFTITEVLIKPYRDGLDELIKDYQGLLLDSDYFSLLAMSASTFLSAAKIGGSTLMRTPDAIHIATAVEHQCDFFITNDKRIRNYQGVQVLQVSDFLP